MKTKAIIFALTLAGLMATSGYKLLAQGTAFMYQGQLQNNGSPASGTYDLTFTLFTTKTGGSAVAEPVTNSAVFVTNGLFTVTIDFGSAVWNGATNWLQIGVETNGGSDFTTLSPRQRVTPTPYAITAENLDGGGLSGTYSNALTLSNPSNQLSGLFTGNGAGLTNVNVATLGGLGAGSFWQIGGNSGVPTGSNYIGNNDNQYLDLHANGIRAMRLRLLTDGLGIFTNAPNVIGGSSVNLTAPNVVGAFIGGGGGNTTNGTPFWNEVYADFGTIGGGYANSTVGRNATVGGGYGNAAGGASSFVGGGGFDGTTFSGNLAQGNASVIGGGLGNVITSGGGDAFIGGGYGNNVSVGLSTVGGGYGNSAANAYVFIGGGFENSASGPEATVSGGGENSASWGFSTVGGGLGNAASGTSSGYSTISGGESNSASGDFSFIGGGQFNITPGAYATLGGGYGNIASFPGTTVGGGYENLAVSTYSTVSGGFGNYASGYQSTTGGGSGNNASGSGATVNGGVGNAASGYYSTVAGGNANSAGGYASFAAGQYAQAPYANSFVWADGSEDPFVGPNATGSFAALASGGVFFYNGSNGVSVDHLDLNNGTIYYGLRFGLGSGEGMASKRTAGGNQHGLDFYTGFNDQMSIANNGFVGINTTSPSQRLEVNGNYVLIDGGQADDHNGPIDAYIGGNGSGSDVQVGSMNGSITTVGFWNEGAGAWMHIACSSITINGGSDLAEPFAISSQDSEIPQGSVVVIDDQNPGHLKISNGVYDTRVAGVISGANGVNPGIQMRQQGLLDGGKNVALTGRVYVLADASNGPIGPGDLLTTSSTPGHAMKVTDHAKAQGAILGKAMTGLSEGKGMVLVLVTLQ